MFRQPYRRQLAGGWPQAYLRKAPGEVAAGGQLGALLGVFQKLLASKALDHEGFAVLAALMARLPQPDFDRHLPTIWQLLFQRCGAGAHVERASRRFNMPSTLITIQHDGTWTTIQTNRQNLRARLQYTLSAEIVISMCVVA